MSLIIHSQLSILNYPFSIIHSQLSILNYPFSIIHSQFVPDEWQARVGVEPTNEARHPVRPF